MSLRPATYGAALEKARSKPPKLRKPMKRGTSRLGAGKRALGASNGLKQPSSKPRKPLNQVGKKGAEWIKVRNWLRRHFRYAGIMSCEGRLKGCTFDDMLSWAHCRKRRKLLEGEIYHVALLCLNCHNTIERLTHEEMHHEIHLLISKRGLIAPEGIS